MELFVLEIWRFEQWISLSEKKPPLVKAFFKFTFPILKEFEMYIRVANVVADQADHDDLTQSRYIYIDIYIKWVN